MKLSYEEFKAGMLKVNPTMSEEDIRILYELKVRKAKNGKTPEVEAYTKTKKAIDFVGVVGVSSVTGFAIGTLLGKLVDSFVD